MLMQMGQPAGMGGPHTRAIVKSLVVSIPRATLRLVRGLATLVVKLVGLLEAHVGVIWVRLC